jgi:hypothetical protein
MHTNQGRFFVDSPLRQINLQFETSHQRQYIRISKHSPGSIHSSLEYPAQWSPASNNDLILVVCILLRVLDQVQGFPSNATVFK